MKPSTVRTISFFVALVFVLPLPLGIMTGFYLWLSPYLFLNSVLASHQWVGFHLLAVVILLAVIWKHRLFCHWVCPTGYLCDIASRRSYNSNALQQFPLIHKYLCVMALVFALFGVPVLIWLDPVNLFYAFFDAMYGLDLPQLLLKLSGLVIVVAVNLYISHIWCRRLCPLGGLQDLLYDAKQLLTQKSDGYQRPFEHKRRLYIGGAFTTGLTFALRKVSHAETTTVLRPPGAQPESLFNTLCARCGNCMKACPADIIVPSLQVNDPLSVLTPKIRFQSTYCTPECTTCGDVCPSGAINDFTADEKKQLVMGIAEIDVDECLLAQNKECDLCKSYCPYDAIAIKESDFDFSSYPDVIHDRCVGCGACEIICPVDVILITPMKQYGFED